MSGYRTILQYSGGVNPNISNNAVGDYVILSYDGSYYTVFCVQASQGTTDQWWTSDGINVLDL